MKAVVREWIEKTKIALMERERKEEIVKKFKEIFGIEPDQVRWTDDKTLEARTRIKDELDADLLILDRKVTEVTFYLLEEKEEKYDASWRFEQRKKHWYHIFTWWKRVGIYVAMVEIYVKRSE